MKKRHLETVMNESAFENGFVETDLLELNDELTDYPHCRLPSHYFDLLLRQQRYSQGNDSRQDRRESEIR